MKPVDVTARRKESDFPIIGDVGGVLPAHENAPESKSLSPWKRRGDGLADVGGHVSSLRCQTTHSRLLLPAVCVLVHLLSRAVALKKQRRAN